MSTNSNASGNLILNNPGYSAILFAIVVFCTFVGAIYVSATSHHDGGGHQTAPATH